MEYLRLLAALFLPWLGGYLWLAAIENRFNPSKHNTLRQVGYGLFIGYAGLQGIVLAGNALTGTVAFWPLLAALALATAPGAVLFARNRPPQSPGKASPTPSLLSQPATHALFWVLLTWTTLHLLLVAIEILHRPIFPWDAWFNWIYRAKTWFYSGQIIPMDHPGDWLKGAVDATYNVAGNHYPTFSPVLALWTATALGHWSETLINLPVLFCGIALGLAMYGQCREFGLTKWQGALCAYLLLSIPLVDTHLALGGKADIWMTGFTGLGFVALLQGIIRDNRFQLVLGLGMVAMGIATKLEGTVWFLAALMTVALAKRPGLSLAGLAVATVIAVTGWILGTTYLEIPLLGGIGLADGRIHIPLLGSYGLKTFDLWDDYQDNFFESGTWHLLWTFVLLSVASLWFVPAGRLRRTLTAFYAVLLAAQLFIFEATESGKWAEDWTAINRLPLHFAPPLIFAIANLAAALWTRVKAPPPIHLSFKAPLIGLIITLGGTVAYLLTAHQGTGGTEQTFTAKDLRIVVGVGRLAAGVGLVEGYDNNIAILSSGPVQLQTEQLGLLRVETEGANQAPAKFFWRNGSAPEDLHSTEISGRGTRLINLDEFPQWQGEVSELGLIFYSDGGKPAEFHRLTLTPHSLASQLGKLAHDWSEISLWSQRSVNWLPAGAATSSVPLPVLLAAWLLVTLPVAVILSRGAPAAYANILLCAVIAWALLDLRWTAHSLAQAGATTRAYPLVTATHLDFGDDKYTRQLVERARPIIEGGHKRTLIMAEDQSMHFQVLRAKYHALPAAVYAHEGRIQSAPAPIADYILVLKKRYADQGHKPATAKAYARVIKNKSGLKATPVWDEQDGFLLEITPKPAPGRNK